MCSIISLLLVYLIAIIFFITYCLYLPLSTPAVSQLNLSAVYPATAIILIISLVWLISN